MFIHALTNVITISRLNQTNNNDYTYNPTTSSGNQSTFISFNTSTTSALASIPANWPVTFENYDYNDCTQHNRIFSLFATSPNYCMSMYNPDPDPNPNPDPNGGGNSNSDYKSQRQYCTGTDMHLAMYKSDQCNGTFTDVPHPLSSCSVSESDSDKNVIDGSIGAGRYYLNPNIFTSYCNGYPFPPVPSPPPATISTTTPSGWLITSMYNDDKCKVGVIQSSQPLGLCLVEQDKSTTKPTYYAMFVSDTNMWSKAVYADASCKSLSYVNTLMSINVGMCQTPTWTFDSVGTKISKIIYTVTNTATTPSTDFLAGVQSISYTSEEACEASSPTKSNYAVFQTNVCLTGPDGSKTYTKRFCSSDGSFVSQVFSANDCSSLSLLNSTKTNSSTSCDQQGTYEYESASCFVSPSATSLQALMTLSGISWNIQSKASTKDTNALLYSAQMATLKVLQTTYTSLTASAISVVFIAASPTVNLNNNAAAASRRRLDASSTSSSTTTVTIDILTPSTVIYSAASASEVIRQGQVDGKFNTEFQNSLNLLVQQVIHYIYQSIISIHLLSLLLSLWHSIYYSYSTYVICTLYA